MADYIPILDSQLEPKAPVTSELMFQLRDNPLAMFEGAVGAPRLKFSALDPVTAGSSIRKRHLGANSGVGGSNYQTGLIHGFLQEGSVRCVISFNSGQMDTFRIRRIRNGVTTTMASKSGSGTLTSDVSVIHGDIVFLEASGDATTASGTFDAYMQVASGQYLWVGNGSDSYLEGQGT